MIVVRIYIYIIIYPAILLAKWLSYQNSLCALMGSRNGLIERFYTLLSRSTPLFKRLHMQLSLSYAYSVIYIVPFLLALLSDG